MFRSNSAFALAISNLNAGLSDGLGCTEVLFLSEEAKLLLGSITFVRQHIHMDFQRQDIELYLCSADF